MTRWPRQIAMEIAKMPTLKARREALKKVEPHLQQLVKMHIKHFWQKGVRP
jgi:hypothetical protein